MSADWIGLAVEAGSGLFSYRDAARHGIGPSEVRFWEHTTLSPISSHPDWRVIRAWSVTQDGATIGADCEELFELRRTGG
jgi:hypothetical protein